MVHPPELGGSGDGFFFTRLVGLVGICGLWVASSLGVSLDGTGGPVGEGGPADRGLVIAVVFCERGRDTKIMYMGPP